MTGHTTGRPGAQGQSSPIGWPDPYDELHIAMNREALNSLEYCTSNASKRLQEKRVTHLGPRTKSSSEENAWNFHSPRY